MPNDNRKNCTQILPALLRFSRPTIIMSPIWLSLFVTEAWSLLLGLIRMTPDTYRLDFIPASKSSEDLY